MTALRVLVLAALVAVAAVPAFAGNTGYTGGPVNSFEYYTGDNDAG